MTTPQASRDWENAIDLRRLIEVLIRRWWVIAIAIAALTAIGVIYTYGFQESVYESSAGAALPPGSSQNGVGLTPPGYREFASSTPVMESIKENLGLELSAGQLRSHYRFQVDENNFITASATAGSAEFAYQLASTWLEAYGRQVQAHLEQQVVNQKRDLVESTDLLEAELESKQGELTEFNLGNPSSITEPQLADLESMLSRKKLRLQDLNFNLIPGAETRLSSLSGQTAASGETTGGGGAPGAADSLSPGRNASAPVAESSTSPAYFELTQGLMTSQLSDLQSDLVDSESSLRQLTLTDLPIAEARLASLKKARLDGPVNLVESSGIRSSMRTPAPSPVYARLTEDIAVTEVELETLKKQSAILENKVSVLRQQINDIRADLVLHQEFTLELRARASAREELQKTEDDLIAWRNEVTRLESAIPDLESETRKMRKAILDSQTTRRELESEVARLSEEYNVARSRLESLSGVEANLTAISSLSAMREPGQPSDPISPDRSRNIVLLAFLGLLIGGASALVWEFYRFSSSS